MHYNQTIEYIMDSNEWIAKKKKKTQCNDTLKGS